MDEKLGRFQQEAGDAARVPTPLTPRCGLVSAPVLRMVSLLLNRLKRKKGLLR